MPVLESLSAPCLAQMLELSLACQSAKTSVHLLAQSLARWLVELLGLKSRAIVHSGLG